MKYLISFILILLNNLFQEKLIFKEYVRADRYSYCKLTLYEDRTYYFYERFDIPGATKDLGKWKISGILISNARNKMTGNKKLFKSASFKLEGKEVNIYSVINGEKYNRVLIETDQSNNK